jgi:sugar phosphate isomerase/epimerase
MKTRRDFIKQTGAFAAGSLLLPSFTSTSKKIENIGIQLYTVRKEMLADAIGTLKQLAALGIKQIESAGSEKGYYYGLQPKEIKTICADLGMKLSSGHIRLDDKWKQTLEDAVTSGQEYLICSSMPTTGQTVDNYKRTAEAFNKAGEDSKKATIKFGYHNHDFEFEKDNGQVLYDVLLNNTDPKLVNMELDLGWVVATGNDPLNYFKNHPGRFPLWHLKDMDLQKKQSTEFGKGGLQILQILQHSKQSGMKYFYVEQEEYTVSPFESMQENMKYLAGLKL